MATVTQDRCFQRINFDCLVKFEVGEFRHDCELVDISLRGALIHNCTGATPGAGSPCRLILSLDEPREVQIIMKGSIAHKHDNRVGISCKYIDIESMTHLRKLVELNQADPVLLEREIMSLYSP